MKKYLVPSIILVFSISAFSWKTPEGKAPSSKSTAASNDEVLSTVMNPEVRGRQRTGFFPKRQLPSMAKRPDSLENKTVYLVENGFGGSHRFMVQLEKWFNENMPSVNIVRKRKPGMVFMDDPADAALWKEVKEKGHAVVMGVAG
jgi:hypothetical protein